MRIGGFVRETLLKDPNVIGVTIQTVYGLLFLFLLLQKVHLADSIRHQDSYLL